MARRDRAPKTPPPSPEELASALASFNKGVEVTRGREKHQQAVARADRKRKDAGNRMKALLESDASAEEKASAESEYREAVEAWRQLVSPDEAEGDAAGDAGQADPAVQESGTQSSEDSSDDEAAATDDGDPAGASDDAAESDSQAASAK